MENGDFFTAAIYYGKALEFDENDKMVIYKIAEATRLYNDYDDAAKWYEKHITLSDSTDNRMAVYHLAEMKKYLGKYDEAKTLFQQFKKEHPGDSNFYVLKSAQEVISCDTALRLLKNSIPVEINNMGKKINSVYSDFGAHRLHDSILYFSSQRFAEIEKGSKNKQSYVSKIMKSGPKGSNWDLPQPIDRLFNPAGYLNCNSSISGDHKLMVFTRCTPVNVSDFHAEIYLSKWENAKWQYPVKAGKEINSKEFTSTHPNISAYGATGYILFFSSDRPGGTGGLDLYKSLYVNGKFSEPENLGPAINTPGNEITPYFDNLEGTLYFSSDWHAGLGGYDIFISRQAGESFVAPVNMGYPLNGSTNDLYFTVQNEGREGLFTSNRPGSMFIDSETCCYDIYSFEFRVAEIVVIDSSAYIDSVEQTAIIKRTTDSVSLSSLLPLKLYFDNDEPGRRSTDTVTTMTYDQTYRDYISRKNEYREIFTTGKEKNSAMIAAVDSFFTGTVEASYAVLDKFASLLLQQLGEGRRITMTVQGTASPLAEAAYNEKLSKRRISSLLNYLSMYNRGSLNSYIRNQYLVIQEIAAGESLAAGNVSDKLEEKSRSVYHPDAAMERRIEVTTIRYEN